MAGLAMQMALIAHEEEMTDAKKKQTSAHGLGRGLNALFGDEENTDAQAPTNSGSRRMMPIDWLKPNPNQPRTVFDKDALTELASSIKQHGVLQPLLVRPIPEAGNRYEIVAGERRWRASQIAQLHEVPVTIQYLTDETVLELALIENLQREDLGPLEEAEAYQQLMQRFGHTQDRVAEAVGKSRSHIANMVRLLNLPELVKEYLREGKLTAGHARTLVTAEDPIALAKAMVEGNLSVREAENLTGKAKGKPAAKKQKKVVANDSDPNTALLEREMTNILGLTVSIESKGKSGKLVIEYDTLDQLDDVLRRLSLGSAR
ncbi:MAG TPA: ParB/RepB/Spo0J family partition protein [Alphaproteobacteria bacterium]